VESHDGQDRQRTDAIQARRAPGGRGWLYRHDMSFLGFGMVYERTSS